METSGQKGRGVDTSVLLKRVGGGKGGEGFLGRWQFVTFTQGESNKGLGLMKTMITHIISGLRLPVGSSVLHRLSCYFYRGQMSSFIYLLSFVSITFILLPIH